MDEKSKNVFDYTTINQINSNKKENLKKYKLTQRIKKINCNQGHLKIINYILFEIILIIILPKINNIYDSWIEIKVNKIGDNQILSNEYNRNLPSLIYVNDRRQLINKKVSISSTDDIIRLEWNNPISDFSFMFSNLENIEDIKINHMFKNNNNLSYMFYNCSNLQNFDFDIDYL